MALTVTLKAIHQPVDADLDAVGGPGNRHGVEHARRQRIAHRADAGRLAVRPGFETDVEHDGDALAVRPLPIRLLVHFRLRAEPSLITGGFAASRCPGDGQACRGLMNQAPVTTRNASSAGAMASTILAAATAAVAAQPIDENASAKVATRDDT